MIRRIIRELFVISLVTWLILLIWELLSPGSVRRFINLEYGFFGLLVLSLYLRLTSPVKLNK